MIHLLLCECLTELDTLLGLLICFISAFSQSLLGAIFLPFPYLLLPCLGIFLGVFFTLSLKNDFINRSSFVMGFFILQQICSLYAIMSLFPMEITMIDIILNSFFLGTGTLGVLLTYHLQQLVKQPLIVTNVSIS